jgi:DMSO/TMAO reductase YedYZ molybdopterin-dependent catalytic subunit
MSEKIPPGQKFINKWPVRTVEPVPTVKPEEWKLEISGLVTTPISLTLDEIKSFPIVEIVRDFHCVETWTVPDNTWKGVRVRDMITRENILDTASFVVVSSWGGFTSEMAIDYLMADDTLLAWERNGKPIPIDHGYPLRLIVPNRYAYKSVKWVTGLKFVDSDIPGYWEERGYNSVADVWKQERYS